MADPQSDGVTVPTLVMTGGPLDGTTYPLTVTAKELVLGSSMDADVQIMLGNVEPAHASLSLGSAGLAIADGGSATGTFVNGEKVEGVQALKEGDRICLGPPGAKGSAKLLVRIPGRVAAASAEEAPAMAEGGPGASPFGEEAAPLIIDDSAGSPLVLEAEPAPPSEPAFGAEPPSSPPPGNAEADVSGEEILPAEEVVVDDGAVGPPLEASEVPPEEDRLFDSPLPPPPPVAAAPAAPPAEPEHEAPPVAADPGPLTAPPPEDYQTELPSIPFAPTDEPEETVPEPAPPPPPPAPSRAPARRRTSPKARRTGRRPRGPSIPIVPVAGGLIGVLAIGAAAWWFLLRPSAPEPSPAAPSAAPAAAGAAPAVPPGTPHVTAVEPEVALPGESVLIRGEHLSPPVSVTFGGTPAEVAETTEQTIRVVLPDLVMIPGQKTELVVQAGGTTMEPMEFFIGRLPLVLEVTPTRGPVGERVVIKGRGFDPNATGNAVTFGGAPSLVLTASSNELTVVAPTASTAGSPEIPVVVTAGGRASADNVRYFLTRATASAFVPRFFAAPVTRYPGEPLAFVSTPLAPVLLLGGPGPADSTAIRAADLSEVLNRLVTAAASKQIEIEFRPSPTPSVAVAGEVESFLVATPEDTAAYSRAWETGARSRGRVQARALARHWAALLQDYFGLFVYRQRPLRMLALSPRGQVFMNIYTAARRRGRGRGVPTSIVYPTTERMATDLTQAALVVSGGTPREEVAVEGRWEGTIQDPDRGDRRFAVELRLDGKGVSGSMTTWRGSIQLSSPLRDISFRRGTLKFTADLQGTPHQFEGVLEEETITGTAKRQGLSPAPFTLQYTE
ncbi:MAG: IPT/TIG domain-containing protein [Acidobacteriota bacterium]